MDKQTDREEAEKLAKKAKDYLDLCHENEQAAIAARKQAFQDWMGAEKRRLALEVQEQIAKSEGK